MNEKIKELAKEAGLVSGGYANGTKIMTWRESFDNPGSLEKFAELIVWECAKKGFDIFDEEPDAPASDLQFYVRDRILQHFGVEE